MQPVVVCLFAAGASTLCCRAQPRECLPPRRPRGAVARGCIRRCRSEARPPGWRFGSANCLCAMSRGGVEPQRRTLEGSAGASPARRSAEFRHTCLSYSSAACRELLSLQASHRLHSLPGPSSPPAVLGRLATMRCVPARLCQCRRYTEHSLPCRRPACSVARSAPAGALITHISKDVREAASRTGCLRSSLAAPLRARTSWADPLPALPCGPAPSRLVAGLRHRPRQTSHTYSHGGGPRGRCSMAFALLLAAL